MTRPILISLALGALACDPGYDVTVRVVDARGDPVAGADVHLDCPPGRLGGRRHHMEFGTTDKTGSVRDVGIGDVRLDCWLHAPRNDSDRVDVAACCTEKHPYMRLCSELSTVLHVETIPGGSRSTR